MSASLFLNRNAGKSLYDSIRVVKRDGGYDGYSVVYSSSIGSNDENIKKTPTTSIFKTEQELYDYIELTLNLIIEDNDVPSYIHVDLIVPSLPITSLKVNETTKKLILKSFRFWVMY